MRSPIDERRRGNHRGLDEPSPAPQRVRRVLGKVLIDAFCPFGEPRCQPRGGPEGVARKHCALAESCAYGVLYAASETPRPPMALFTDGDAASLEVTLFGPAWRLYSWVIRALAETLRRGLGKERQQWSIRAIERVRPNRVAERLCGEDPTELSAQLAPDLLAPALEPFLVQQPVVVDLLSPTRLIDDGKLVRSSATVPFRVLIARILDRFRGLYGDQASEILRPEIRQAVEAEAARVPLLQNTSRWVEVDDYSARSRSELKLGGKIGRLVYGAEAARFFPLLRVGEVLQIGKNPTAGCGRIRVDLLAAEPESSESE